MWLAWHNKSVLPEAGGYLEQSVSNLALLEAMELIFTTYSYIRSPKADFSTLSATQYAIIKEFGA